MSPCHIKHGIQPPNMLSLMLLSTTFAAPVSLAPQVSPSDYPHSLIHQRSCKADTNLEICQYDKLPMVTVGFFADADHFKGFGNSIAFLLPNGAQRTYSVQCQQNRHPVRGMVQYCYAHALNWNLQSGTSLRIGAFGANLRLEEFVPIKAL
jgi:hypothetical protein